MSDFAGNEELLQDFLTEAGELLAQLENHLLELERSPGEAALLNAVFRDFHTIKGGAGFLGATELVKLCHLTENLFDRLRNGALVLTPALLDLILAATAAVRAMFASLAAQRQPQPAEAELTAALEAVMVDAPAARDDVSAAAAAQHSLLPPGEGPGVRVSDEMPRQTAQRETSRAQGSVLDANTSAREPDWAALLASLTGRDTDGFADAGVRLAPAPALDQAAGAPAPARAAHPSHGRRATDDPAADGLRAGRRESDKLVVTKDTTIRIDTARLDQVLNLSGEIGLAKNRLNCLRAELTAGKNDAHTLRALDEAIGQLDLLVGDLQNAVMKTRMQPVGRLFQKYPRLVRDLARQLGKDVSLQLSGEETELDRSMIEELSDPLLHLVRNAIDHGLETPAERAAFGKPAQGAITLRAQHSGDHIIIEVADNGRGMQPEALRRKAIQKGLLDAETIRAMDDRQALQLIFLPGFSTKDQVSSVSGRGVGMDVVKTNIQKLNGRIDIASIAGDGTCISISLPLTLAILPVLVVQLAEQPFALPLSMVREILRIDPAQIQSVSGKATLVLRDEVLPVRSLAAMLDMPSASSPAYGVLLQTTTSAFVLAVDGFVGRDDVVIKPLDGVKPKGIAGATLSGDGSIVLVLDIEGLSGDARAQTRAQLLSLAA